MEAPSPYVQIEVKACRRAQIADSHESTCVRENARKINHVSLISL